MPIIDALRNALTGVLMGPPAPGAPPGAGSREALIHAGLRTLMAAGRPHTPPLAALAEGLLSGQEYAAAYQQQAQLQAMRDQIRDAVRGMGFNRDDLGRLFFQALGVGDLETAKYVSEVLKAFPSQDSAPSLSISYRTLVDPETGRPREVRIATDPRTGAEVSRADVGEAFVPPTQPDLYEDIITVQVDGRPRLVGIMRGTGQRVDLGEAAGGGGAQRADPINVTLSNLAGLANQDISALDEQLTRPLVNFSRRRGDTTLGDLSRLAANLTSDNQAGVALSAAANFVNFTVRYLSGAQMTEAEAARIGLGMIPTTWDPPEVRVFKENMRNNLVRGMRSVPGEQWIVQQTPENLARLMSYGLQFEAGQRGDSRGTPAPSPLNAPDNPFSDLVPPRR
ncbi:MAG: hypothetical protein QN204_04920 [Armatimonadota bacterium]|nr:hypothetical protein [Armatimonadota bacterium]